METKWFSYRHHKKLHCRSIYGVQLSQCTVRFYSYLRPSGLNPELLKSAQFHSLYQHYTNLHHLRIYPGSVMGLLRPQLSQNNLILYNKI